MMFRAAVVLAALALPAYAQHGGSHAASIGNRGFAGHSGFSSHPAFSQPAFSHPAFSQSPNLARPAQPYRNGAGYGPQYRFSPGTGFRAIGPLNHSTLRSPYTGNRYAGTYSGNRYAGSRFAAGRSPYDPSAAALSRGSNQDRFDARRRQFRNWYVNTYPNLLGYPYLLNPNFYNLGLYDWSDSDNSQSGNYQLYSSQTGSDEYAQNGSAPLYPPYPDQGPPNPNEGYYAPVAHAGAAVPAVAQPLTVIFKSGRAPVSVQNYLMTARVLTDLDSEHYEQIPLDQIDLAATQNFNKVAGVDFQVPFTVRGPSRD